MKKTDAFVLPRPMCFVAMPFGRKKPSWGDGPEIDFDSVYPAIRDGVGDCQIDCIRGDEEQQGGFIHRPMYERLVVAEHVVADVTDQTPNALYELGVRHGASALSTVMICERGSLAKGLPFDLRPLRVISYTVDANGRLSADEARALREAVRDRLRATMQNPDADDNPIAQVTLLRPGATGHEKTDVFVERMKLAGEVAARILKALDIPDRKKAIDELAAIEEHLLAGGALVPQLYGNLLLLFLGYRDKEAYDRMLALYERDGFPPPLQRTPVALEQRAFALNRLAERRADAAVEYFRKGEQEPFAAALQEARTMRRAALDALDAVPEPMRTSETWGIRGRIFKKLADMFTGLRRTEDADDAREQAIQSYEQGFRADPRDYFPGVNAVTLRLERGQPADRERLKILLPAVRFAIERAPAPASSDPRKRTEERYFQRAAALEMACVAGEWNEADTARGELARLVQEARVEGWMLKTTADNLKRLQRSPIVGADSDAPGRIAKHEERLRELAGAA